MRAVRSILVASILLASLLPELSRYRGERRLAYLDAIAQILAKRSVTPSPTDPRLRPLLAAADAVQTHPGDWRPLMTSGTLRLAVGDRSGAAERFTSAMHLGERPELDVNLASIHEDQKVAGDLRARALWLTPSVEAHLPGIARAQAMARVRAMERRLHAGTLGEGDFPAGVTRID